MMIQVRPDIDLELILDEQYTSTGVLAWVGSCVSDVICCILSMLILALH